MREVVAHEKLSSASNGASGQRIRSLQTFLVQFISVSPQKLGFTADAIVEASGDFDRRAMSSIFSPRQLTKVSLTQKLVYATIQNPDRDEIMRLILRNAKVEHSIPEETTSSIVGAFSEDIICSFLDKYKSRIVITDNILKVASRNQRCGNKAKKSIQQMLHRS